MSYTPTVWRTGDKVTSAKLNKLEQGVANAGSDIEIEVDSTLTQQGKPADAKAVGDALANIDIDVDVDTTLTQQGVPADAKSVGDAMNTKLAKPTTDGTSGQVLMTNGQGGVEWGTVQGGGSSVDIDDTLTQQGEAADSKAVGDALALKMTKPTTDGTNGQVLTTDGNGNVAWNDAPQSGDTLPSATTEDNGKILSVENGTWTKVNVLNNDMVEAGVASYLDEHPDIVNEMKLRTFTAKLTMAAMSAGGNIYQWQSNFDITATKKCVGTIYWIELGDFETGATITCKPYADINTGETFKVYFFTSEYGAISNSVLTAANDYQTTVPANTKFIKLGVTSSNALTYGVRYVDVSVVTNLLRWHGVRNFLESSDAITTNGKLKHNQTVFEVDYNGQRLTNYGWFFYSPDYKPVGKKSKIAFLYQGSDGYKWKQDWSAFSDNYHSIVFSLVHSGYCVALCSSSTELNYTFPDCSGDQVSINAYDAYYKFVTENFNVEKEPYIIGYSNGGMPCGRYNVLGNIPAKAIAGGAIVTEIVGLFRILGAAANINRIMHCCGVPSDVVVTHGGPNFTSSDFEVLKSQGDILKNYSPFFMSCNGLSWNDYIDAMKNVSFVNMETNSDLVELMSHAKVNTKIPIKMWHARDDVNVSYGLEKFYIEAVNRGGGIGVLRTMPNDAGKHAMGNYGNADSIKVENYHFSDGTVADTTLFMTEVLDWFAAW